MDRPRRETSGSAVPGAGAADTAKAKGEGEPDSGDEYASEHEDHRTKDDDAFIDNEGDDAELVREYEAQKQDFRDDRPDGFARKRKRDKRSFRGGVELDDGEAAASAAVAAGKKGGKRKVDEAAEEQRRRAVADKLLRAMVDAAKVDRVDAKAGRQAVKKLRLLPEVRAATALLPMHDLLLDGTAIGAEAVAGDNITICKAFRDWLKPLPPAELPQLTLRSAVYEMLAQLPVTSQHLSASRLGEVLLVLSQHPSETPENRTRLESLLARYMRLVFGRSARYDARGIDTMLAAQHESSATRSQAAAMLTGARESRGGADDTAAAGLGVLMGGDDTSLVSALLAAAAHEPDAGTPAGAAAPGTNVAAEPVRQTRHAHIPAPMVLDFVRRPAVEALPSAVPSRKQQKAAGETPAAQLKKRIIDKKRAMRKAALGGAS